MKTIIAAQLSHINITQLSSKRLIEKMAVMNV